MPEIKIKDKVKCAMPRYGARSLDRLYKGSGYKTGRIFTVKAIRDWPEKRKCYYDQEGEGVFEEFVRKI